MTTNHQPRRTTLRALAAELHVNHGSLSSAFRAGRLTRGLRLETGRLVVTDADAAAANWHEVHVPTWAQMVRDEQRRARASQPAKEQPAPDLTPDLYAERALAGVLIALHLLDSKTRTTAIAKLRARVDSEAAAYTLEDSASTLACFDRAVEAACEWLDERDEFIAPKKAPR